MLHTACDQPAGYNRVLLYKAFEVPFNQWGYKVLMSAVETGNIKSRNIAKRLGFTEFATLPDAHPTGALHFVRMYRKDCRWLDLARRIK
jgi:RimJ/RimL family protein N-acetyltransferase